MAQKKKTSSVRKATYAKAGTKRRKLHVPEYVEVPVYNKRGKFLRTAKRDLRERKGPGSNRRPSYCNPFVTYA